MTIALHWPKGPNEVKCLPFIHAALFGFIVAFVACNAATVDVPQQSPRARLEEMVKGAPITDSSTTVREDADWTADFEPQSLSSMSPADRFRQIVQAEALDESATAQVEPAAVLHPIQKAKPRRPVSRQGTLAKVAAGVLPSAALFSQVLIGSRMKANVLEDRALPSGFAEDTVDARVPLMWTDSDDDLLRDVGEQTSRGDRVKAALTSKTALGITAAIAALAGLYLSKQAWDHWKKRRAVGLLAPATAKWDLQQCLLIVDIRGAHEAGALRGKYVSKSARVKVDVNTQHATLTYSVIPAFTNSPVRSLMRRVETVQEHFHLPVDHCFVSAARGTETKLRSFMREYMEKTTFRGERVAALAIHAEKSPGLQLVQHSATPPGPPPTDLLDAIHLKHQTTGENAVEMEESPTVSANDGALGKLEGMVYGKEICGGAVLCVDSISISTTKNLCTVHAAVEDMRPISVLADIPRQTLSIVVRTAEGAAEKSPSGTLTAEYHIELPRHCVLADASLASYTVAPFSVELGSARDVERPTASVQNPSDATMTETGDDALPVASDTQAFAEGQEDLDAGDRISLEADISAADRESSMKEGPETLATESGSNTSNSGHAHYQHVRIQFRPLPRSEVTVSLSLLPEKQLPR